MDILYENIPKAKFIKFRIVCRHAMAEFFVAMSKGRLNLTQQHKIGNQLKYAKLEWHGSSSSRL